MAGRNLRQLYQSQLTQPGVKEGIREPLYDYLPYDSGTALQLGFFQRQAGTSGVTFADTNMPGAGQLPKGWKFVVDAISIDYFPGSNAANYVRQDPVKAAAAIAAPNFANDVYAIASRGFLQFNVGQKPYLTAPLLDFPSMSGLFITPGVALENEAAGANQITCDYARVTGKPFQLNPVLPLDENTGFVVTLNWAAAVVMPSGFDPLVRVTLHGTKFRQG